MSEPTFGAGLRVSGASAVVVVPMFNEVEGAERCVRAVTEQLGAMPGWALVVVDDGSDDGTGAVLEELKRSYNDLGVVHRASNGGYGAALRSGVEHARGLGASWVVFMDSDLTNPPEDLIRFALAMDGADYVKATRYAGGGGMIGVPAGRRLVSQLGNALARLLCGLPLSDITNGYRAIRVEAFLALPLRERGFAIISEEAYWVKRHGLRCREIPTTLTSRTVGQAGSSFRYTPTVFYAYGRYPVKALGYRVKTTRVRGHRSVEPVARKGNSHDNM